MVQTVSMAHVENGLFPPHRVALVRLVPDDWPLWRGLRLQALQEAPQAFCSTLQEWQGQGDTEARWRNRLTSVPFNLLATLHGQFVGMVGATEKNEHGTVELISLWVAPSGRGHGIGSVLVDAVIAWAAQQSATHVALDVKEDNGRAKVLYLRHGFVNVGQSSSEQLTRSVPERRFLRTLS